MKVLRKILDSHQIVIAQYGNIFLGLINGRSTLFLYTPWLETLYISDRAISCLTRLALLTIFTHWKLA